MANADYRVNVPCPIDPRMDPRRYNDAYRGRENIDYKQKDLDSEFASGRESANIQRAKKEDFNSFKLIKDPFIHKCETKIYRYDGKPLEVTL